MYQNAKHFLASWTIWFGFAQIAVALFGYLSGSMDGQTAFAMLTTGLGTIGLRLKTTQPIAL